MKPFVDYNEINKKSPPIFPEYYVERVIDDLDPNDYLSLFTTEGEAVTVNNKETDSHVHS